MRSIRKLRRIRTSIAGADLVVAKGISRGRSNDNIRVWRMDRLEPCTALLQAGSQQLRGRRCPPSHAASPLCASAEGGQRGGRMNPACDDPSRGVITKIAPSRTGRVIAPIASGQLRARRCVAKVARQAIGCPSRGRRPRARPARHARDGRRRAHLHEVVRIASWTAGRDRGDRAGRTSRPLDVLLPDDSAVRDGASEVRVPEPRARCRERRQTTRWPDLHDR